MRNFTQTLESRLPSGKLVNLPSSKPRIIKTVTTLGHPCKVEIRLLEQEDGTVVINLLHKILMPLNSGVSHPVHSMIVKKFKDRALIWFSTSYKLGTFSLIEAEVKNILGELVETMVEEDLDNDSTTQINGFNVEAHG